MLFTHVHICQTYGAMGKQCRHSIIIMYYVFTLDSPDIVPLIAESPSARISKPRTSNKKT